jgi:alginate O-acetyltransferase complex protein AlgI
LATVLRDPGHDAVLFCSQKFLLFFLAVFAVYWAIPRQALRVYLLLLASFVFYAAWNEWLAVLIIISTTVDYLIARALDALERPRLRRLLLGASVLFNVGILCYFKYANFFLRSLEDALRSAGASSSLPVLSVILPVGISFYTFEAISYAVDVFRRKLRAERNLAHFMLFILFFPHLIAGPIVRGRDFLPQVRRKKRWNWMRIHLGLQLFLLGMAKKLAIADRLAMMVDPVFADPAAYNGGVLWLAALAYAVQVYCDFSGYSDMALGTAHLLGYRLAINFRMPFLAPNIAEFWRRWHISLSSWLRDYVFIPLGGSRGSRWATYRNFLIVMGLGGLWHGASWSPVVWGLLMGAWLCAHRVFREFAERRPALDGLLQGGPGAALRIMLTFVGFCLTLIVFRTPSLAQAVIMLERMFRLPGAGKPEPLNVLNFIFLLALLALGHWLGSRGRWRRIVAAVPEPILGAAYAFGMSCVLILTPDSGNAFIYFQF